MAEGSKRVKGVLPDAQIVGEDYHKLFITDYAPTWKRSRLRRRSCLYSDWIPDAANLLKQGRQMGVKLPLQISLLITELPGRSGRGRNEGIGQYQAF